MTLLGILLLLAALGGVVFGVFMATHPNTRESGRLFAVWWVPAVAAAVGVLMRDPVTLTVGALCFLVAGAAYTAGQRSPNRPTVKRKGGRPRARSGRGSERTTQENETGRPRRYRSAAS